MSSDASGVIVDGDYGTRAGGLLVAPDGRVTSGGHTGSVPSVPPSGEPAPLDGALPASSLTGLGTRPFGIYVHVPFCATRCGLLRLQHLHGVGSRPDQQRRPRLARLLARGPAPRARPRRAGARQCWISGLPAADTVFLGGGTPSLLGAEGLVAVLDAVRGSFGLRPGAEVTTEANPESTTPELLAAITDAGYTRLSPGHAVRRRPRPRRPRPPAHARRGGAGRGGGARRGNRARQPRPHLRHARPRPTPTCGARWTPCWPPAPTTCRRTR